jgi:putative ABC transport system permease protein
VVRLVGVLTILALVLGAIGVYGVISHFVQRRSREYGIRLALGQRPTRIVTQVVSRAAVLVGIGSAIGIAAALLLSRFFASLLHGVHAQDPLSFAGAVAVLTLVGALAAFVPARRASLTDPAAVLRQR